MKKSITILWICGLLLAAAFGFFASSVLFCRQNVPPPTSPEFQAKPSHEVPFHKKKKPAAFKQKMDSALGLSQEQIAKLDSNGKACDSLRREMNRKIHGAEKKLHDLLDRSPIDDAAIQSVRAELLLLNEKRLDLRIADIKFFKGVLTGEQIQKLKNLHPATAFSPEPSKDAPDFPPPPPQMKGEVPPPDFADKDRGHGHHPKMRPKPNGDGNHTPLPPSGEKPKK